MAALVEVKDICKVYNPGENEVRALDHVSVSIQEKEFVAIIGHSGSGKSTLMNMLGCLDVPTSGSYFLHGKDVSRMSDDELSDVRNREIGFIFQGFNLIANLTALENVELPLIYRGVGKKERRELAEAALEKVGLGQRMSHKPSEMSGGQQQRVAIARAIAQAPPVFIWHTLTDQSVPIQNTLMFTETLVKNQVSVEAHIFPEGLHGLSLANEETQITETGFGIQKRCQDWITLAGKWVADLEG